MVGGGNDGAIPIDANAAAVYASSRYEKRYMNSRAMNANNVTFDVDGHAHAT
jgi:hypothetical protein